MAREGGAFLRVSVQGEVIGQGSEIFHLVTHVSTPQTIAIERGRGGRGGEGGRERGKEREGGREGGREKRRGGELNSLTHMYTLGIKHNF